MQRSSVNPDFIRPLNPAAHSSWLSKATFWYTFKIFKIGLQRDFDEEDLSQPLDKHRSTQLGNALSVEWTRELSKAAKRRRKPGLLKPLLKCFGIEIALFGLGLCIMELVFRIYQPLFIGLILRYFGVNNKDLHESTDHSHTYLTRVFYYWDKNQSAINTGEVVVYAFGTIFCGFISVLILHPISTELNFTGMKIRIALCSLIYRKVLRLHTMQLSGKTIGNAINILSNDVNKFENLHCIHYLWLGPATVMFSLYFLYKEIGNAAFIGMCPVMFCIPLQLILAILTRFVRIQTAVRTDNRVQVMNELIQGIRVLKMYAWEYAFVAAVHKTRKNEMYSLIKASIIKGIIMSLILFITRSGHFLSCYFYLRESGHITIETVFFVVSFYQILRMTMTVYYPQGVGHVAEMYVSTIRIKDFLAMRETDIANPEPMDPGWMNKLEKNKIYKNYYNKRFTLTGKTTLEIDNITLNYGSETVLEDVSVVVEPGSLTAVVGPVGAGKSCLLHTILGELVPHKGTVNVKGVISYATQDPFLFAGSIRQNILFGSMYNKKKYRHVVQVCALTRDFTLLPYGDRTLVGEKGISLSGGQRARVNLARAVYRDADIYLLDDPLSAVDTNVGKILFEECITGYLKSKIVVLTTHQWQYLKDTEQILFMEDGKVTAKGNYHDVFTKSEFYSQLIEDDIEEISRPIDVKEVKQSLVKVKSVASSLKRQPSTKEQQEMRSTGVVGFSVLKNYYRAGGNCFFIFLIFFWFIMTQVAASVFDYFMAIWARIEDNRYYGKANPPVPKLVENLPRSDCAKYAGAAIATTMCVAIFRSFYFYGFCMTASIALHNRMFKSVTRANLRFFTLNASGRVLNRFSKDMGAVDEILPIAMVDTYQILLNFVGVIGLLVPINVWLLFFTLFICLILYVVRKYYLKASCSLKRLEGIARSPVFTHANASMQGLVVIRSHGNEMLLVDEFDRFQDVHTSASFLFMAVSRAFGYLLDLITVIYTGLVIYYFLLIGNESGANVALILTQCVGLTGIFQWGMRQSAEFETQLTSVERVLEFTKIEPEPPLESEPDKKPPDTWPKEGNIDFRNVSLRYSLTEPHVLRNVTINIAAKEKVGIVGRTGAGKSSIIQTLFRLAYVEGDIIIDGVNTLKIGLHDLRKKISIIPQEPVIYSGTLRYNLDPFNEYSDVTLYSALLDVDLKLAENPDCLNENMYDGGVNLSVGSRQLVCLARAIVRNNKILIMDEATANVDLKTDDFIQKAIRTKFVHCTVLTIAHRLNTIMDSDKVIVMEAGQVMECDHPYLLMKNTKSMFTELVQKTGKNNVSKLESIAKESYIKKMSNSDLVRINEPSKSEPPEKNPEIVPENDSTQFQFDIKESEPDVPSNNKQSEE